MASRPLHYNEVHIEDNEETDSNVLVQDPADDGIPIIMDIIEFFDFPWEDEFEIQTVQWLDVVFSEYVIHC